MKGTHNRILFQNADGNINMGVMFNDPDIEIYEIAWFNLIAEEIEMSLFKNEGLISVDNNLGTQSCYVELQRKCQIKVRIICDVNSVVGDNFIKHKKVILLE